MMTTNHHTPIPKGAAGNAATVNAPLGQLDAAITGMLDGSTTFDKLNLAASPETVTISGGVVTITKSVATIAAESGTADDLDTLNGVSGDLLLIQPDTGDTITVRHGTGNIYLNGGANIALSGNKRLLLMRIGTTWSDLSYPNAGQRSIVVPKTAIGSAASSFTIINGGIPAGVRYLELLIHAKLTGTGSGARPKLRFQNNSTPGGHVCNHIYIRSTTTVTYVDDGIPGVNLPTTTLANKWGDMVFRIFSPGESGFYKGVDFWGFSEIDTSPFVEYAFGGGNYVASTDPLTRIDLVSGGSTFDAATFYALWAVE